jgi:dipeptidyl aminopeptidase/acylaminoacyl peptidase
MQSKCPQAIPYYQKALDLNPELVPASKGLEDCGAIAKGSALPQAAPTEANIAPIATAIPRGTVAPSSGSNSTPPRNTPSAGPGAVANSGTGRIYFPVYDGQYRIFSANPDGSERQLVTELASSPAVNDRASAMLFYSWINDQRGVHRIDTNGADDLHISLRSEDTLPSWSPDGARYVYSTRAGQGGDITKRAYTLRVASTGGKPRQDPAPLVEQAQYPAWGPTNRIVFRDCGFPTDTCGLAIVNADGGGKITLTNLNSTAPAWSPDGDRIVFMSNARGNWDLYVVNATGGSPELLTDDLANDGLPTYSPDGSKIAFVSNRDGVWSVYQIDADGENEVKLFDLEGDIAGNIPGNSPAQPGQTWLEQRISWK